MDLSRREFFKQMGSKATLRKLTDIALEGGEMILQSHETPPLSVDEAGRALRTNRGRRSRRSARNVLPGRAEGTTRQVSADGGRPLENDPKAQGDSDTNGLARDDSGAERGTA